MKCPFKLPIKADIQSNFLFDADDMAAGVIGGEARKAYAVRAINNYAALVEALRKVCEAGSLVDTVQARMEGRALLAELEQ